MARPAASSCDPSRLTGVVLRYCSRSFTLAMAPRMLCWPPIVSNCIAYLLECVYTLLSTVGRTFIASRSFAVSVMSLFPSMCLLFHASTCSCVSFSTPESNAMKRNAYAEWKIYSLDHREGALVFFVEWVGFQPRSKTEPRWQAEWKDGSNHG